MLSRQPVLLQGYRRSYRPGRPGPMGLLEPLESRTLLSADYVGIGFVGDYQVAASSPWQHLGVGLVEGSISDQGVLSMECRLGAPGGPGGSIPLPNQSLQFRADGSVVTGQFKGVLGSGIGGAMTDFRASRGYPVGWLMVQHTPTDSSLGLAQELAFLVERSWSASLSDLQGSWVFETVAVPASGSGDFITSQGRAQVVGDSMAFSGHADGAPLSITTKILGVKGGQVATDSQYTFFLFSDKSVALIADLDTSDNYVVYGVAVKTGPAPTAADLTGMYRVVATSESWPNRDGAAVPIEHEAMVVDLRADGTYQVFDAEEYDRGQTTNPNSGGTWTLAGDTVTVHETGTDFVASLVVGANGSTLVVAALGSPSQPQTLGSGIAVRSQPVWTDDQVRVLFAVPCSGTGEAEVYQLRTDKVWRCVDVLRASGGPDATLEVAWVDPIDGRTYAAGVAQTPAQGLVVFRHNQNGTWSSRNLSADLPQPGAVVDRVQVMITPYGHVTLTGMTQQGELIRYYHSGLRNTDGSPVWGATNLTQDLLSTGQSMPTLVGPLVDYATSWGGLNVAGLDASGNVWSIWWAPGQTQWWVNNLTQSLNAAPVVGGLTVYLTPWNGINIGGVDSQGLLQVTWWVPAFGADWQRADLTGLVGGPNLVASSVSSYVSPWGGLNVSGLDSATGEVQVYWWAPGMDAWLVSSLSAAVGFDQPDPVTNVRGIAGPEGSLNVIGQDSIGKMIRYYWEPGMDAWTVQNLTEIAIGG